MAANAKPTSQAPIPPLSDIILHADGTWSRRRPEDPFASVRWIRVGEAAELLHVTKRCVYNWLGQYLVYRRPSPSTMEVSLPSVQALAAARRSANLWAKPARRAALESEVEQTMSKLIATSLQIG